MDAQEGGSEAGELLGPCQPLRTMLLCAGNLLAPIAVAMAEEGMLEVC